MMLIKILQKKLEPWIVKKLDEKDFDQLFSLHLSNDYYNTLFKKSINKEQVLFGLTQLPPGTKLEQKHYIGFFQNNNLIACMDFVTGYPDKNTVFIGLLMVALIHQGRGIGSKIVRLFMESINECGYHNVRLGCLTKNTKAYRFWLNQRFMCLENKTIDNYDVIVMQQSKQ